MLPAGQQLARSDSAMDIAKSLATVDQKRRGRMTSDIARDEEASLRSLTTKADRSRGVRRQSIAAAVPVTVSPGERRYLATWMYFARMRSQSLAPS